MYACSLLPNRLVAIRSQADWTAESTIKCSEHPKDDSTRFSCIPIQSSWYDKSSVNDIRFRLPRKREEPVSCRAHVMRRSCRHRFYQLNDNWNTSLPLHLKIPASLPLSSQWQMTYQSQREPALALKESTYSQDVFSWPPHPAV